MEQGHAAGTKVRRQAVSRWMRPWLVTGDHLRRIGLVVISVAVAIVIACAPFGMEWIARFRRDWVTLGNIAQAYGGFSALISAIALVGVVGSLLIQVRQHSLDRSASIRGRQAQIYAVVREDPELYWPVLGGVPGDERSIRQHTMRMEFLHYCVAGYECGLIPEKRLRTEVFPGFFTYEENRDYWASIQRGLLEDRPSKKFRRFARIANEELQRARATGPGLTISLPSEDTMQIRLDREPRWRLPVLTVTAAAGFGLLLSRHRNYSEDRTLCRDIYGAVQHYGLLAVIVPGGKDGADIILSHLEDRSRPPGYFTSEVQNCR